MVSDVEHILNNNEFPEHIVDHWYTQKSVEQHRKEECLKGAISKGKVNLPGGNKQWIPEWVDKSSGKTINLEYAE